jgi:hypothetical protein
MNNTLVGSGAADEVFFAGTCVANLAREAGPQLREHTGLAPVHTNP